MAEIKIEQKKPIWPWLLVGLIVIGALFYFLSNKDNETETNAQNYGTTVVDSNEMKVMDKTNPVNEYVTYIGQHNDMDLDHEFTNEALLKLISATDSKAKEVDYAADAELADARMHANEITEDPTATDHADHIKEAGASITNVLEKIQTSNYPDLKNDADDVKKALESIKTGVLTLDQKDEVKNFFRKSADLLDKMN